MIQWIKKPYVIIGIGVGVGVVSCVIKVLQKQNNDEIIRTKDTNRVSRSVQIPKGFVGHVLGRGGATIKSIRDKSRARITFDDSGNEFTVATISGSPENVETAADLISEILSNRHACVTKEIILEEDLADSVWRNVNYIRQICDLSRAKIQFDFLPAKHKQSPVKVIIKGKKEEVEAATSLIDELVAKSQVNLRENNQIHVAGRALPDNVPLHSNTMGIRNLPSEHLVPNSTDGFLETFVSAVETPSRFWVQISGSKSIQLDKLATEMTEFYNDRKNSDRFHLNSIGVDDIVAAFFEGDSSWYRAQVKTVAEDEERRQIGVFYLDFGDCSVLDSSLVSLLKPDFLSIPFQAIECCLAGVAPVGEGWTEEATQAFKKMVYAAEWKVIMTKPVEEGPRNGEKRQVGPNQVQLLDTCTEQDIDIAKELVSKGLARMV